MGTWRKRKEEKGVITLTIHIQLKSISLHRHQTYLYLYLACRHSLATRDFFQCIWERVEKGGRNDGKRRVGRKLLVYSIQVKHIAIHKNGVLDGVPSLCRTDSQEMSWCTTSQRVHASLAFQFITIFYISICL